MQNGDLDPGYDIGPGEELVPPLNSVPMHQSAPNGMVPIDVISGFHENENGEMEMQYERAYVAQRPFEPLDQGPDPARASGASRQSLRKLYSEKERLATFDGNWSPDYPVLPRDLARDGLYYVGPGDRVKCVFCEKTLRLWELGDDVKTEHRRNYPTCPFVLGRCTEMNVPNNSSETMQHSYGVSVRQGSEAQRSNADRMQDPNVRLRTFDHRWPSNVPVDPTLMAEAGLHYIGVRDKTKCFRCHTVIQSWERGDDPWREHARISPQCPFVLEVKGREFVEAAVRGTTVLSTPQQVSSERAQSQQVEHQEEEMEVSGIANQMSRLQIDEDMNSPAVKAFRETFEAVPLDQIRQQLERVRLEKGPTHELKSTDFIPLLQD